MKSSGNKNNECKCKLIKLSLSGDSMMIQDWQEKNKIISVINYYEFSDILL